MPQISVGGIKDRVNTALAPYLGTRTYGTQRGTKEVQALVMDYGTHQEVGGVVWAQKPQKRTGLEVVIQPQTEFNFEAYHGRQFGVFYTTVITLKQWDVTDTVLAAAAALVSNLGDLMAPGPSIRVQRNSGVDSIESQAFQIVHQIK